jgi:hypothetical protein
MSEMMTNFTAADMPGAAKPAPKVAPAKKVAAKPAPKVEAPKVEEPVAEVVVEAEPAVDAVEE